MPNSFAEIVFSCAQDCPFRPVFIYSIGIRVYLSPIFPKGYSRSSFVKFDDLDLRLNPRSPKLNHLFHIVHCCKIIEIHPKLS